MLPLAVILRAAELLACLVAPGDFSVEQIDGRQWRFDYAVHTVYGAHPEWPAHPHRAVEAHEVR